MIIEPMLAERDRLLAAFGERARRAGCDVQRRSATALADPNWFGTLRGALSGEAGGLALAPAFLAAFPDAGRAMLEAGGLQWAEPAALLRCAAGVSACVAGVAETGSLLLAGAEPADRLVWLLPPRAVLVVRASDILPTLHEAMAWLREHREVGALTLVTGPSRTSDVERVLTIGVQGPRALTVVLVADDPG